MLRSSISCGDTVCCRHRAADLPENRANARGVAPVGQRRGEPGDDAAPLLGGTQRQHITVRRLAAAVAIDCELLGTGGCQVERKRRSVVHGCGVALRCRHARRAVVFYAISPGYATASAQFLEPDAWSWVKPATSRRPSASFGQQGASREVCRASQIHPYRDRPSLQDHAPRQAMRIAARSSKAYPRLKITIPLST